MRVILVSLVLIASCGGQHITPADTLNVASEWESQRDCVYKFTPDASAIHACRQDVVKRYDTYWSAYFVDGGAK